MGVSQRLFERSTRPLGAFPSLGCRLGAHRYCASTRIPNSSGMKERNLTESPGFTILNMEVRHAGLCQQVVDHRTPAGSPAANSQPPEKSGRPITHWTYAELADEAKKRGIVESISATQVGRYLREAELQPHKSRYWLNSKEKDPQVFQQKVEAVCDTYLAAPRLHQEENTHTVCVDEMTGIQALERAAATLPMEPGQPERREFEYERHGTITLTGNFEVVTGALIAPTLGPTRTELDFVQHIAQTVSTDPEAPWVFVLDNLVWSCGR